MERKTHNYSKITYNKENRFIFLFQRGTPENINSGNENSGKDEERTNSEVPEEITNPEGNVESQYKERMQKAQETVNNTVIQEELVEEITNPEGNVEKRYNEEILGANDAVEDPETKEKLNQNAMVGNIFNEIVEEINSQSPKSRLIADKLDQLNTLAVQITTERGINYDGFKNYIETKVNSSIKEKDFRLNVNDNNKVELQSLVGDPNKFPDGRNVITYIAPLEQKVKAWGQIDRANELVKEAGDTIPEGRESDFEGLYNEMKEMENLMITKAVEIHDYSEFRKAMNALESLVNPSVEPKIAEKTEAVPLPEIVGKKSKKERNKNKRPQSNKEIKRIRISAKKFEKENPEASAILKDVATNPKEYLNIAKDKAKEASTKVLEAVKKIRWPKVTSETTPIPEPEKAEETPLPPKPKPVLDPLLSTTPTAEPAPETSSESDTEIEPEIGINEMLSEFNKRNTTILSIQENANPEDYEKIIQSLPNIEAAIKALGNDDRFALEEVPIVLTNSKQNTGLTPTDIYGENVITINYLQTAEEITETILNSVAQIEETEKDNEGKS